jgi:hypothetical protein
MYQRLKKSLSNLPVAPKQAQNTYEASSGAARAALSFTPSPVLPAVGHFPSIGPGTRSQTILQIESCTSVTEIVSRGAPSFSYLLRLNRKWLQDNNEAPTSCLEPLIPAHYENLLYGQRQPAIGFVYPQHLEDAPIMATRDFG